MGLRNFLISAWSHYREGARLTDHKLEALREVGGKVFVDSGMLSALGKERTWADQQEAIAELARRVHADYVSHLDVPMERSKLAAGGYTRRQALEITVRNARAFLDADTGNAAKVFVIQGWTIEEYEDCIQQYADFGIVGGGKHLGIGTCCMRPATRGLWQIIEAVRQATDGQWLHSFGTGDPSKLARLAAMGIDSVDEGNTIRALMYKTAHPGDLQRLVRAYRGYEA